MAKAEQLAGIVEKILSPKAEAEIEVSGFQVYVRLHTEKNADEIAKSAEKKGIADDAVSVVIANATLYIPFAELVDIKQEVERLKKEEQKLIGEIARANGMLNNEKFISKAPESKIAEEKAKLDKYTQMLEQVRERLATLG